MAVAQVRTGGLTSQLWAGFGKRQEPTATLRDDAGVIAIIVALSISTFLLGFAALAVDLGMAYERQSQLQSIADRVAMAGAQGLPAINGTDGAVADATAALNEICKDHKDFDTTDSAGLCPVDPANPTPPAWMRDGQAANGEVTFYQDTGETSLFGTNGTGQPVPVGNGTTQAEGIKVVLPPSKVAFGFAGAFTNGSTNVVKSATARIGTPLGAGILPFSLTQADLNVGQWCVKTGAPATAPNTPPTPTGGFFPSALLLLVHNPVQSNTGGQHVTFTITGFGLNLNSFSFYATNNVGRLNVTHRNNSISYSVEVPVGTPGSEATVWAVGKNIVGQTVDSSWAYFDYSGTIPTTTDPCTLSQADRGYSQLARTTDDGGSSDLTSNIRVGPQVREYATGGLVGSIGTALDCVSRLFSPATTCLSNVSVASLASKSIASNVTSGLFSSGTGNSPGRLEHDCGPGLASTGHSGADADASQLLSGSINQHLTSVDPSQLRTWVLAGDEPGSGQRGWVTSKALRCGRLAVMPVINPLTVNGLLGGQSIVSFTYVWIDDLAWNGQPTGNRGVNWSGHQVSSIQGYVINPGFLPAEVAGSLTVGPYLGANMPKEAVLVHNLGAPDA